MFLATSKGSKEQYKQLINFACFYYIEAIAIFVLKYLD